ncbi:MAG: hypothetical protein IPP19_11905 [Verrucomicrobia bacterium]|nr:hypothetical protein [Verrucomicrobiota bacterium]
MVKVTILKRSLIALVRDADVLGAVFGVPVARLAAAQAAVEEARAAKKK